MAAKRGIDASRIDPQFLFDIADPLAAVYESIEHDLLVNIARQFRGGIKVPKGKIPGSYAWRAYMLQQIGKLTNENIQIIAAASGDISELTQMAVRRSVEEAIAVVEPEMARQAAAPDYVPAASATAQRVIESYDAQALNRYNKVNTVMLNSSLEAFRKCAADADEIAAYSAALGRAQATLNAETGAVILGSESWTVALRKAVQSMARDGLTGYTDKAGKNWSAQNYVLMDIRTTAANAARQAVEDRNKAYNNNLISCSSHPGSRPGCRPWQGGVYSLNGWSGDVKDGSGKVFHVIPLAQTSYGTPAGLYGINCGHMEFPFFEGVSIMNAEDFDTPEDRELYKRTQKQRGMERRIRKMKTEADVLAAAGDADAAREARRKARLMNADLKEWCEREGMPYYPDRVRVIRTSRID